MVTTLNMNYLDTLAQNEKGKIEKNLKICVFETIK